MVTSVGGYSLRLICHTLRSSILPGALAVLNEAFDESPCSVLNVTGTCPLGSDQVVAYLR